jgi:hypothetical protein
VKIVSGFRYEARAVSSFQNRRKREKEKMAYRSFEELAVRKRACSLAGRICSVLNGAGIMLSRVK